MVKRYYNKVYKHKFHKYMNLNKKKAMKTFEKKYIYRNLVNLLN